MKKDVILDTGPLVAYLSENDNYHEWATEELKQISFLVQRNTGSSQIIVEMLQQGLLVIPFILSEALIKKPYRTKIAQFETTHNIDTLTFLKFCKS
ncbi:hypothetical protein [Candidatus Marithrix sp. Canyon 246]|uniref:hypothetical protein n=1 Tax=Candidatus Marithrix sp. Canyon 246 TaxID=1827136 RepID=UPI00084A1EF5|nr:hypothetical protein [Candidatus Marithrix sp. Canyon 246]